MNTSFATSFDGCRIAYDVSGSGLPIVLLHGGGHTRQNWHSTGYVGRLKSDFKVVTLDIRGSGQSDKPRDTANYTTDKHCKDILAVADACGLEHFAICGFSYGGNIGRYLAAQSARITKLIMVGIPFGPGASGDFRQFILRFRDHWLPIVQAQADGTLDVQLLSPEDQGDLQHGRIPATLAWLSAMLEWATIEPRDLLCPTLWLVGSRNDNALTSIKEYESALKESKVQVQFVDGLNHEQEFTEIDQVLPMIRAFIQE
jgi:pimeloyl-ACP methyl ester carboxylesterase